ncbi:MAG: hypothetical protein ACFFAO_12435 [Candidatus Hermodarchaeota archaeon]
MVTKTFCDICDRSISGVTNNRFKIKFIVPENRRELWDKTYDVCAICYSNFNDLLEIMKNGKTP